METALQVCKFITNIRSSLVTAPNKITNSVFSDLNEWNLVRIWHCTDSELWHLLPDAAMFDAEYSRWLDDDSRRMIELRGGLHAHLPDSDLRAIVDDTLTHYNELFRLKDTAARTDVFHLITGMWATPAERCFLWIGGFRPSDMLKVCAPNYTKNYQKYFYKKNAKSCQLYISFDTF